MAFDVARVRGLFPSLGDGWIHFDPQVGMLIPDSVATTVSTAFRSSMAGGHGRYPSARRTAAIVEAARLAIADLVGGDPRGVVLGPDRAVLLMNLAESMSRQMGLGSEVVVTRLDDEANIAPWLRVADRYGAVVKWAEIDIESGELPTWQWEELVSRSTRVVAMTAASSVIGSMPDVQAVAKIVHAVNGIVVVDANAAAPYGPLDIGEMGADVLAVNASSWGGPQVGALVFRDPGLLERFTSLSLEAHVKGPARLEVGEYQPAMLAGLVSSVEHLANLDEDASGTRRDRVVTSLTSLQRYHGGLLDYLLSSLRSLPPVVIVGAAQDKVPTVTFSVDGVSASNVANRLADNGICAQIAMDSRALDAIGVADIGGAVTIGLGHYSTGYEVDQLVRAVASLA